MVSFEEFIKYGTYGAVTLGASNNDVESALGEPDDYSVNTKPLLLVYGGTEFAFYSSHGRPFTLRAIVVDFSIKESPFYDFKDNTIDGFLTFLKQIGEEPFTSLEGKDAWEYGFLSGVSVDGASGEITRASLSGNTSRHAWRSHQVDAYNSVNPAIESLFEEAFRAFDASAPRAALLLAWSGLEACILEANTSDAVASSARISPLQRGIARKLLNTEEFRKLEAIRKMRSRVAHGDLGNIEISRATVVTLAELSQKIRSRA